MPRGGIMFLQKYDSYHPKKYKATLKYHLIIYKQPACNQIGCFNHRVVTMVAWVLFGIRGYMYKTTREVVSLCVSSPFQILWNEEKRRKQGKRSSYTNSTMQPGYTTLCFFRVGRLFIRAVRVCRKTILLHGQLNSGHVD